MFPLFTVCVEATIHRPVEEVFSFIADAENDFRWCPSVKEIERIEGEDPGPGAKYRMVHEPGGMRFEATVETTHFEPHERIEWRTTDSGHKLQVVYELEPVGDGAKTRLRQTSQVQTRGWLRLPGWLFKGYIKRDMKKEMTKQFQNLKDLLEQDTE